MNSNLSGSFIVSFWVVGASLVLGYGLWTEQARRGVWGALSVFGMAVLVYLLGFLASPWLEEVSREARVLHTPEVLFSYLLAGMVSLLVSALPLLMAAYWMAAIKHADAKQTRTSG